MLLFFQKKDFKKNYTGIYNLWGIKKYTLFLKKKLRGDSASSAVLPPTTMHVIKKWLIREIKEIDLNRERDNM